MGKLSRRAAHRRKFRRLDAWISDNLSSDLTAGTLARKSRMSLNYFNKTYRAAMGQTPAKAVERLRVDYAIRLMTEGGESYVPLKQVARTCGFGSEVILWRAFRRQTGMTADEWRELDEATRPREDVMTHEEKLEQVELLLAAGVDAVLKEIKRLEGKLDRLDQRVDRIEPRLDTDRNFLERILTNLEGEPGRSVPG